MQASIRRLFFHALTECGYGLTNIACLHVTDAQSHVTEVLVRRKTVGQLKILVGKLKLVLQGVQNAALKDQAVRIRLVMKAHFDDFEPKVEGIVIGTESRKVQVVAFVLGIKARGFAQSVNGGLELAGSFVGFAKQIVELGGVVARFFQGSEDVNSLGGLLRLHVADCKIEACVVRVGIPGSDGLEVRNGLGSMLALGKDEPELKLKAERKGFVVEFDEFCESSIRPASFKVALD